MRTCPACKTQYSDDTLRYCLQDGSPLDAPFDQGASTLVIAEPEIETDPRGRRIDVSIPSSSGRIATDHRTAVVEGPANGRSKTPFAIAAGILIMLLLLGIGGVAGWLFFSSRQGEVANSTVPANVQPRNTNISTSGETKPVPSVTKTPSTPRSTPAQEVDDETVKQEVSQTLSEWRSETERLDIDSYMDHYAPRVDYYNKQGASRAAVRADKMRAFSRYDLVRLTISNLSVTPDSSGETATAVFDKEWYFSGNGVSSGKVRQLIKMQKIDGDWLITAEKDLKVY